MDFIVAVSRALANASRLRLLRAVHKAPGITVGALAADVALGDTQMSNHLRLLAGLGLVDLRPSGRRVHVHPPTPKSARNEMLSSLNRLLTAVWRSASTPNPTPHEVWDWVREDETDEVPGWQTAWERMAFCFTAYTHLRRLLMLRALTQHGAATQDELCERIGMSPSAGSRQLGKLRRRGVVRVSSDSGGARWEVVRSPSGRFQRRLHGIVMRALADGDAVAA